MRPILSRFPPSERAELLLLLLAAASACSFAAWRALLNNFAVDEGGFDGAQIGLLQSLREIPGFLAFSVVFLLAFVREQRLAYVSVLLLGAGTALTGISASALALYLTTVLMSIGFHYYETVQTSLALQWIPPARAPVALGRLIAASSLASVATFGAIWVALELFAPPLPWIYAVAGGTTIVAVIAVARVFPEFTQAVPQHRRLLLRRRYWLYYVLTFLSGARRQIFTVFAALLMVEKFGFSVSAITLLFLGTTTLNAILAPRVGRLVARFGERRALVVEYVGLIGVFVAYAFVESPTLAVVLYMLDHVLFALATAIKTYFQKIADPQDIAATAGVGFTINHIAAVVIPVVFGLLWLRSPATVFIGGAVMAALSLGFALNVPPSPGVGREVIRGPRGVEAA